MSAMEQDFILPTVSERFVAGKTYVCRRNAGLHRKILSIANDVVTYIDQSDRTSTCNIRSFRVWFEADKY